MVAKSVTILKKIKIIFFAIEISTTKMKVTNIGNYTEKK